MGLFRREWFGPSAVGAQGFTPASLRKGQTQLRVLGFLPLSTPESQILLATPNRSSLQHAASALRSLAISALSGQCPDRAGRQLMPNMPSADFCAAIRSPHGSLSPESRTRRRPPEVSSTAFPAPLPGLQPWPLMDMDFAISCPLVRPRLPLSGFCSSGRGFAPRFLQTLSRDNALASR